MKVKSKQPSKQRKALFNYSNHHRSKLLSTRVADFLRDEYGIKRLPLRVGDQVRVCRGEFTDFEGEVLEITKNQRCKIKECTFDKTDGTQFHPAIHISNLVITKFTKEKKMDPWRAIMIERKVLYGFYEEELKGPKKEKEVEK
ncbi:MAG: 50S ribosomal protein L24 [Candidatus Lokiarchaeota archaeon]|nr:50S ribosomal protein L24 [Candidatus Lokiarchaeota archaeon]MCK4480628.1 50S ribosomal protein L24 [Candidatus Lokiarchaeota archaeon]MCK4779284.1 50S ribosomal protein L24 [Candidatus Lokiarchaeota archaeon]TKJ20885.1 MAG: 50S ribosomal protein L24 [Candidatus Lokiarchaeota archaeon Loki_b32]